MKFRVLRVVVGFVVVVISFWITLIALDNLETQSDPSARSIKVSDATYGMNCRSFVPPTGAVNTVRSGNVTEAIGKLCDGEDGQCDFVVDVAEIGDPAPGCAKDLAIGWLCGNAQKPRHIMVAPEAHGKRVNLTCP